MKKKNGCASDGKRKCLLLLHTYRHTLLLFVVYARAFIHSCIPHAMIAFHFTFISVHYYYDLVHHARSPFTLLAHTGIFLYAALAAYTIFNSFTFFYTFFGYSHIGPQCMDKMKGFLIRASQELINRECLITNSVIKYLYIFA